MRPQRKKLSARLDGIDGLHGGQLNTMGLRIGYKLWKEKELLLITQDLFALNTSIGSLYLNLKVL